MREQHFQREWIDSWRRAFPGDHIIKIPDVGSRGGAGARFVPEKPYDFYAVHEGQFIAMEAKLMTKLGGFPFNALREGQEANLREAADAGGEGWIVINYRVNKFTAKQAKNADLLAYRSINQVFIIGIELFRHLDLTISDKSIPVRHIVKLTRLGQIQTVDWAGGGIWNLSNLFPKEDI